MTNPEYEFFVAAPPTGSPPASSPTSRAPSLSGGPISPRLPRWVNVLAAGQGFLVVASGVLAYSTLRTTRSDTRWAGGVDRYIANYDSAVSSHLTLLIAVIVLAGVSIAACAILSHTEALGWAEGVLLVIVAITAFAPPTVPAAGWQSSPLGVPYGWGPTGLIAAGGALVVLGSLARSSIVRSSMAHVDTTELRYRVDEHRG